MSTQMPLESVALSSQWKIGTIVALKSHPFFNFDDPRFIVIAGDPQLQSPLMIIIEVLKESKTLYDENTGERIVDKDGFQCRCTWFSQKSSQIEESWFSNKQLKVLQNDTVEVGANLSAFTLGAMVTLKTAQIELGKKKSSFKKSLGLNDDSSKSITSILAFVSPVMQVIGKARNEIKEPLIDTKTGEKKRQISHFLIKCRYYNQASDKLSEVLLPKDSLTLIDMVDEQKIDLIRKTINDKTILAVKEGPRETLIRAEKINYLNGYYNVDGYDYLENSYVEIPVTNKYEFRELSTYVFQQLPVFFHNQDDDLMITRVNSESINQLPVDRYWRIRYKDKNDKITYRTINHPAVVNVLDIDSNGRELVRFPYLKAFCMLRGAERCFLIERIQKIEVLDLNIEIG